MTFSDVIGGDECCYKLAKHCCVTVSCLCRFNGTAKRVWQRGRTSTSWAVTRPACLTQTLRKTSTMRHMELRFVIMHPSHAHYVLTCNEMFYNTLLCITSHGCLFCFCLFVWGLLFCCAMTHGKQFKFSYICHDIP